MKKCLIIGSLAGLVIGIISMIFMVDTEVLYYVTGSFFVDALPIKGMGGGIILTLVMSSLVFMFYAWIACKTWKFFKKK